MNHRLRKYRLLCLPAILLAVSLVACEKNPLVQEKTKLTKNTLYEIMKDVYLWYEEVPDIDPADYASLNDLLDAVRFEPTDRWSSVISTEEYDRYYQQAEYIGHGFGLYGDDAQNLWVSFVYEGTQAESQGVERGWQILTINGIVPSPEVSVDSLLGKNEVGVENSFQFKTLEGGTQNLTLAKEVVDINAVLHYEVINVAGTKAGYLVYQNFLLASEEKLDEAFKLFQDSSVQEIIVDFRYNPGGDADVARHLGSLIAGEFAIKRDFVRYEFNDKHAFKDLNRPFEELTYMLSPTPSRVFFIATESSASASEVVINGLMGLEGLTIIQPDVPFEVYVVGGDTYGKPVGSQAAKFSDSTLQPITFRVLNRKGEGEYFEGLTADSYVTEDVRIAFGDPNEKLLKEVLHYIEYGEWTGAGKKSTPAPNWLRIRGLSAETGAI